MTTLKYALIILVLTQVGVIFVPVFAGRLSLVEGATLYYTYARGSSWQSAYETLNASIEILTLNETTLVFRSNTTPVSTTSTVTNIKYSNGIPEYADYLTALIFLPSKCMVQTLQGSLNWTRQIETLTPAIVTDSTLQNLNFTVEAGSFQSVNITLTLAGMDSGALTLIYDVASGIMIYEQWIPIVDSQIYGDIIILSLNAITSLPETPQTILSLISGMAVFTTPTIMLLHETRKKLQRRHRTEPTNIRIGDSFPRKLSYMIIAGGLLTLASIMLPWSHLLGSQIYLPFSIFSVSTDPTPFFASTSTLLVTSLTVHLGTIAAWIGITMHLYTSRRSISQMVTIASSVLIIASVILFMRTGWTVSWGMPTLVTGVVLMQAGTIVLAKEEKSRMNFRT